MWLHVWIVVAEGKPYARKVFAFRNEEAAKWCASTFKAKGYDTTMQKTEVFDQVYIDGHYHGDLNNIHHASELWIF